MAHRRHPFRFPFSIPALSFLFLLAAVVLAGCSSEAEKPVKTPELKIPDLRGTPGAAITVPVRASNLPSGAAGVEWTIRFRSDAMGEPSLEPGPDSPVGARIDVSALGDHAYKVSIDAPEGIDLADGQLASLTVQAPKRPIIRQAVTIHDPQVIRTGGATVALSSDPSSFGVSLIGDPVVLLAFLSGIVALIYWLSTLPALEKLFTYCPPLIWMYFVPMVTTTLGITPDSSALYSPFMSRVVLPAILVLLLIPTDVKAVTKLGSKAVLMMLFATTGIVVGAIGSFGLFNTIMPSAIPEDTWKGIAALAGSWIGGSTNMFAVLESVGTPPNIIGPLVIVDTVLAYSWLGLLIALVPHQDKIDRKFKADTSTIEEVSAKLLTEEENKARAPKTADIAFMLGIALIVSQLAMVLGNPVFHLFDEILGLKALSQVVSSYAWGILIITAAGLLLSMTKVRDLGFCGASSIGYVGLYLLLTTYGARANLVAILEVPVFFGIGAVWMAVHVAFLYAGFRILRVPVFLAATSSMANIGGTASAPVVAAAYNQSMAPVGLLMAILGGVLGTPLALFVIGTACRAISGG